MSPHFFLELSDRDHFPEALIDSWIERGKPNPYRATRKLRQQEAQWLPEAKVLVSEMLMLIVAIWIAMMGIAASANLDEAALIVGICAGLFVVRWALKLLATIVWRKMCGKMIHGFEPFLSHYENLSRWSRISYEELAELSMDHLRQVATLIITEQQAVVMRARVTCKPHKVIEQARTLLRIKRETLLDLGLVTKQPGSLVICDINYCRRCGAELPK